MRYQPVIGLEIHAELLTDSKVFCTCQNEFGGSENTRVCPRCSGLPGTLPLLNQGAVRLAAKAGFVILLPDSAPADIGLICNDQRR